MARKRTRLPSGVKRLPDGRLRVRVTLSDPMTQERKDAQKTLQREATLEQAVAARDRLRQSLVRAGVPEAPPSLADYCKRWLARKATKLRPKTISTYSAALGYGFLLYLGEMRLDQIRRHHVLWVRDELEDLIGELSAATIKNRWCYGLRVLRAGLADAELRDCTRELDPPAGTTEAQRELRTLSIDEVHRLVDAADGRYATLVAFLAYTGCRLGEAVALCWGDVDLEGRVARIQRSATIYWDGERTRWQVSATKSDTLRRAGLPPRLVELLRAYHNAQPGIGEAPVWSTSSGLPVRSNTIYACLDRAAEACGLEITVRGQVLRRTFNTLALEANIGNVLLQSMIGHTSDRMSAHYHGLRPETAARVAEVVWGDYVGPGCGTSAPREEAANHSTPS